VPDVIDLIDDRLPRRQGHLLVTRRATIRVSAFRAGIAMPADSPRQAWSRPGIRSELAP
jgi:hypothetical protein